jgi:ubiquitin-like protein 4
LEISDSENTQYILPKYPQSPVLKRKRDASSGTTSDTQIPGQSGVSITLKSLKPSAPSITLSSINVSTTSIFDLKSQYASQTSLPTSSLRILYNKRPCTDSKTVADVLGSAVESSEKQIEFSVMVMGGTAPATSAAAATPPTSTPGDKMDVDTDPPVAQGLSGEEVLKTDEFWRDLKGFLMQRIRDEKESERLFEVFKGAWQKGG